MPFAGREQFGLKWRLSICAVSSRRSRALLETVHVILIDTAIDEAMTKREAAVVIHIFQTGNQVDGGICLYHDAFTGKYTFTLAMV